MNSNKRILKTWATKLEYVYLKLLAHSCTDYYLNAYRVHTY